VLGPQVEGEALGLAARAGGDSAFAFEEPVREVAECNLESRAARAIELEEPPVVVGQLYDQVAVRAVVVGDELRVGW
jgi:hypothetical protein